MAIIVGSNFKVSTNLPIDERMIVQTIAERDAIPANLRFDGLVTYVVNERKGFQLRGGIANSDWVNSNLILPAEIGAYDKSEVDSLIAEKLTDKVYVDAHIADTVKHITAAERTAWNNKLDKAGNISQDVSLKQLTVHGNILPGKDGLDIGSATQRFRSIYVDEAYLSTNTLYLGDTPIMGTDADTVNIKTDPDQSLCMKTSATGTTTVTSEKAVAITTSGMNSNVTIQTTGVNSQTNIAATARINLDAPDINLDGNVHVKKDLTARNLNITGDFTVGGTLTTVNATNLEISDNIIDINKGETGQGVAEGIAGIKIDRGDLNDVLFVFDEVDDKFKVGDASSLLALATEKHVYDNRYIHPAGTNPHGTTKADVGLSNVTNESKATMFTSPSFTGTPVAPTAADNNNSTHLATTAFVMRESAKKANASHGVHIPTPETANARKFLRNDNSYQLLPEASTAGTGIVKLNDAVNSDSLTEAATAHALKVAYDLANSKANTSVATPTANGLMSKQDKTKLDDIAPNANNYVHPAVHEASMITESATRRFITDTERNYWNAKSDKTYVDSTFLKLTGGTLTGGLHTKADLQVYSTDSSPVEFLMSRRAAGNRSWKFNIANGDFRLYNKLTEESVWEESLRINSGDRGNLYLKGQKVYHTGAKPTPSEIGASSSDHNHDGIYAKYGTALDIYGTGTSIKGSHHNVIIGGGNAAYSHYISSGTNGHWFNKAVYINGEIYAGSSYAQRVYHQGFKPTAQDVQALPIIGGTLTGDVQVNGVIKAYKYGSSNNNAAITLDKIGTQCYGIGCNGQNMTVQYGQVVSMNGNWSASQDIVHEFKGVLKNNGNLVYHAGYKPSPSDIGASDSSHLHDDRYLRLTGGVLTGQLKVGGAPEITNSDVDRLIVQDGMYLNSNNASGDSYLGFAKDGQFTMRFVAYAVNKTLSLEGGTLLVDSNKVYHEGFRPTPVGIGAEPAFAKQTAFNKDFAGNGTAVTVSRSDHSHLSINSRGRVDCETEGTPIAVKGLSMSEAYPKVGLTSEYPFGYGNILNMKDSNNDPNGGCNQLFMGWNPSSTSSNGLYAGVWVRNRRDVSGAKWSSWAQVYTTAYKPTKADVGLSLVENYAIATITEAQAGTNNTAYMTPLRVKEAISTLAPASHNHDSVYLKMSGGQMTGDLAINSAKPKITLQATSNVANEESRIDFLAATGVNQGVRLRFNHYDIVKPPYGLIIEKCGDDNGGAYLDVEGDIYSSGGKVYHQNFKPTKSDVGLSNVDNTTDINKPISTATQNALNTKLNLSGGTITGIINKYGLDTDFTVMSFGYGDGNLHTWHIAYKGVTTTDDGNEFQIKSGTGRIYEFDHLGNLEFVNGSNRYKYYNQNFKPSKSDVGLTNVDNTSDLNKPISTATQTALNTKVDKVTGKQLSTENYSTAEKTKLAGISANANNYVHPTNHAPSVITQDANNRFVTDTEKSNWNAKETPTGAQSKADKALADAKTYSDAKYLHKTGGTLTGDLVIAKSKPILRLEQTVDADIHPSIEFKHVNSQNIELVFNTYDTTRKPFGLHLRRHESNTQTENKTYFDVEGNIYSNGGLVYHSNNKPSKVDVGLSNVDNTSDLNKPISTATQTALNTKFDKSGGRISNNTNIVNRLFTGSIYSASNGILIKTNISEASTVMVDMRITGNGYGNGAPIETIINLYNYSTNGIINYHGIATGLVFPIYAFRKDGFLHFWMKQTVSYQTMRFDIGTAMRDDITAVVTNEAKPTTGIKDEVVINPMSVYHTGRKPSKADVGLGNVDNTSDVNKPISTATQIALNTKETPAGAQAKADKALLDAKAYTNSKVGEILDSAPEALDTLKELSAALGNDPNFATTVTTQIGLKADKTYVDTELAKKAEKSHTHAATQVTQSDAHQFVTAIQKQQWDENTVYTNNTPTIQAIGGIPAGTTFDNVPLHELLTMLLYPYTTPVISLASNPGSAVREKGSSVATIALTATTTKKSKPITKVEFLDGSTVIHTVTAPKPNGGAETYTISTATTTNKSFTSKVYDGQSVIASNAISHTFVYPAYVGVVADSVTTPTSDQIKALTKKIVNPTNLTETFNPTTQKVVIACPPGWTIKQILDPNNFDVTASFNKLTVNVTGLDNTAQAYNVYIMSSATTQKNFTMKFNR